MSVAADLRIYEGMAMIEPLRFSLTVLRVIDPHFALNAVVDQGWGYIGRGDIVVVIGMDGIVGIG